MGTDVPEVVLDLRGLTVVELPAKVTTIGVDMSVSVAGLDGGPLVARVTYDADLFDESTMATFAGQLQSLLAALVADPDMDLAKLDAS